MRKIGCWNCGKDTCVSQLRYIAVSETFRPKCSLSEFVKNKSAGYYLVHDEYVYTVLHLNR